MKSSHLILNFAIISALLFMAIFLSNCKSQAKKDLGFLCISQEWDAGKWESISDDLGDYAICGTEDDKTLGLSFCRHCRSVKVIDFEEKQQRIVLSPEAKASECVHKWVAGLSKRAFELIEEGDYLLAIENGKLYIIRIDKISWPFSQLIYKRNIVDISKTHYKIKTENLKWKEKTAKSQIPLASHKISFYSDSSLQEKEKPHIEFEYDGYYGGVYGPQAKRAEDSLYIAVVHSSDLGDEAIIDLSMFRFKTWEDGLGNRCDKINGANR